MPRLEELVEPFRSNKEEVVHSDFRLFLTSIIATYFSVSGLQNGLKLTTELPRGLKANLKRIYQDFTPQSLNNCSKSAQWRKLL